MARPEPMNATPAHSKAKVSLSFSDRLYVAGEHITGKIELECKAERGLGIADIKVELFAIQGASPIASSTASLADDLQPPRADFTRSLCHQYVPTLDALFPGRRPPTFQCRPRPSSPRLRRVSTSRLLRGKERPDNVLLPLPAPAFLAR